MWQELSIMWSLTAAKFDYLMNNGVNVMDYQNEDGSQWPDGPTLHHKYAVIDFEEGSENPLLITGSHNWSASADAIHDENTLFIYDAEVANWYYQEFHARFFGVVATKDLPFADGLVKAFPNPVQNELQLEITKKGNVQIFDLLGRKVFESKVQTGKEMLEIGQLNAGTYFLKFFNDEAQQIIKS